MVTTKGKSIKKIAQAGLIAKGIVYVLLGLLGFMAAFEIRGQKDSEANRNGALEFIKEAPAGEVLLYLLAAGLVCYAVWRFIQAFSAGENGMQQKWTKRMRYFFSGLGYLAIAYAAWHTALQDSKSSDDQNQHMAAQLMDKPYGTWLVGIAALLIAAIGIYQIYYGLSEKYKKHVQELNLHASGSSALLRAGKIGYVARGFVWLVIAYLGLKAALHANAGEAGDTGKAFQLVERSALGSVTLGLLGLGLISYGIFNFIRARWERLQ